MASYRIDQHPLQAVPMTNFASREERPIGDHIGDLTDMIQTLTCLPFLEVA